jgi:hypothetical protein
MMPCPLKKKKIGLPTKTLAEGRQMAFKKATYLGQWSHQQIVCTTFCGILRGI